MAPEKSCACGFAALDAHPAREAASHNNNHSLIRRFPVLAGFAQGETSLREPEISKPLALNHPIMGQNWAENGADLLPMSPRDDMRRRLGEKPHGSFHGRSAEITADEICIGVLSVWALIFVVGYFRRCRTPGHPLLKVLLGIVSMYIATRIHRLVTMARTPETGPLSSSSQLG